MNAMGKLPTITEEEEYIKHNAKEPFLNNSYQDGLTKRKMMRSQNSDEEESRFGMKDEDDKLHKQSADQWKRILLLVIAITVHNIPGKLYYISFLP